MLRGCKLCRDLVTELQACRADATHVIIHLECGDDSFICFDQGPDDFLVFDQLRRVTRWQTALVK